MLEGELFKVCESGDADRCRELLALGVNVNCLDLQVNGLMAVYETPLIRAVNYNHNEICKLLLSHKDIDVNIEGDGDYNALDVVCNEKNIDIVKLILALGPKRICIDTTEDNPTLIAILENHRRYLPRWNRFTTAKYYSKEFNDRAVVWLLCCKRFKNPKLPKDIQYLIIEYIAEIYKTESGADKIEYYND